MKCSKCGMENFKREKICAHCGHNMNEVHQAPANVSKTNHGVKNLKSRQTLLLLTLFAGYFGVHNFYLGYYAKGIAQLLLTLCGFSLVSIIWAVVDFINLVTGKTKCDANNVPLSK